MTDFKYLKGYAPKLLEQVKQLVDKDKLGTFLTGKYPHCHEIRTDGALYDYTMELKNRHLRKSPPLSKVVYDSRINVLQHALGLHTFVARVQGSKLKAKHEIRIAALFRTAPPEFLRMIVVHELAHLKEKAHNRAFYQLCQHLEPDYHQLEFDLRLYLTHQEMAQTGKNHA
jgi:predicted metal-dependent hydrolase